MTLTIYIITKILANGYRLKNTPIRIPAASRVEYALFTLLVTPVSNGLSTRKLGSNAFASSVSLTLL